MNLGLVCGDLFNYFGRYTADYGVVRHVFGNYGSCGHDGSCANGDSLQDGGMGSYPYVGTYMDGLVVKALPV